MFKKQKATRFFRALAPSASLAGIKKPSTGKKTATKKVAAKKAAARSPGTDRAVKTRQVAVWDVDVHSGYINRVLDAINKRQQLFNFVRIEATVPMGLTMSGQRTRDIVQKLGGKFDDPAIEQHVLADDVYRTARPILKSIQTDLLVCLLAPLIMDHVTKAEYGYDGIGMDFFSVSSRRIVLVSAHGMRNYAAQAGKPFEACLAALIVAQVLAECFKLGSHDDTRGCIMDYCDNRDDIVQSLRTMELCQESVNELPAYARDSALKIMQAIREYTQ